MSSGNQVDIVVSETGARVNAAAEWRSRLAGITGGLLLFLSISGLVIYLVPFNEFSQFNVLVHTVVGLAMLVPVTWYVIRHWRVRRKGKLSHYQLLGYISVAMMLACVVSGFVVTWQGLIGPRMSYTWDLVHLITGLAMLAFIIVHLATVIVRKVNNPDALRLLRSARRRFYVWSVAGGGGLVVLCAVWAGMYTDPQLKQSFSDDYNWRFGEDRPFAPSLARVDQSQWHNQVQDRVLQVVGNESRSAYLAAFKKIEREPIGLFAQIRQCAGNLDLTVEQRQEIDAILSGAVDDVKRRGAIDPRALAGSAGCGTSGCHHEIYKEWLPSAHRYSSMDDMFQRVQELMAKETSPEHTRYCAGCHDPIALFSGAKNSGNITLSVEGSDEGLSCLVCHSIVQTDVQGNGDYTIDPPPRYVYELKEGSVAKFLSDFLIRTYPKHHISSYSRSLYKTPEFCAACHKQYIDESVNTDIGKVQGQNQYDSWKNSRWHSEGDPTKTVSCRECHMPLVDSNDPARGDVTDYNRSADDRKHRSHRHLASNQYIPLLHQLEGAEVHTAMTEQWLRGEIEIPEIAHKWTSGPVVRMYIAAPKQVKAGEEVSLQVVLTNNKTGHDFPTGPLDMIESWVELIVTDGDGTVLHHTGGLDESGKIVESQVLLKADVFDRRGEPIDRHNLWDLVGASYKRTLYPGATDTVEVRFRCPSMARGRVSDSTERTLPAKRTENYRIDAPSEGVLDSITATAILWYRKANPEFLDTVYGIDAGVRAPIVELTRTSTTIKVLADAKGASE